jgi:WD40 repeat protein
LRRYASARELADELDLFSRDEPIRARPLRAPAKVVRWCRRKPALAFSIATAAALLLFVVIGSPIAIIRIDTARKVAEAAERQTEQQLYTALLEQARAAVLTGEAGHRVRALNAARRAGAISNSAALRGVALAALALPDLRLEREFPTTPDTTLAALDPAFERIALCEGEGRPVEIRAVSDQRLLATLPASTNLPALGLWSPDGRFLAVRRRHDPDDQEWDMEVWEVAGARQMLLVRGSPSGVVSFHPRRPQILIGLDHSAVLWDLETGRERNRHRLRGKPVALKFAPDGERFGALIKVDQDWVAAIHNTVDGTSDTFHVFAQRVRDLDWHPSGRSIVVPDFTGAIHWMDAQTGETRVLGRHKAVAVMAVFSPDGKYVFSGGWDRDLICWDVKAMRRAFSVGVESYHVQFNADGRRCAIQVWPDMRVQIHAFEPPALGRELAEDLGGGRNYAAFSADGRWLTGRGEERMVVWDLDGDGPGTLVEGPGNLRVNFAANGELFGNRPGDCFRWRVTAGTPGGAPQLERLALSKPPGFVSLCLVSNGVILTATNGSTLAGFDHLATGQDAWSVTTAGLNGASPDERWLGMFRSFSPYLYIYRLPGFERVAKLTNEARISLFEFSPPGDEVAVSSRGGVEFWSTTTWQRTRHLTNFTGILYSPDARTAWLYTKFRDAGLRDVRTLEPLLPLPKGTLPLAISRDGRRLAVSVEARRVQVWDLVEVRQQLRTIGLDWRDDRPDLQTAKR